MKNFKDTCILTGIIANLPADESANAWLYGNFDLIDETDTLYIYGVLTPDGQSKQFKTLGLGNGDEISLKAVYTEYNNKPQASNAIYCEPVSDADVIFEATDFKGLGKVATQTEPGGDVLFHCDNAYGTDTYGVRCYKDGNLTISADTIIGKIVFELYGTYTGGLEPEVIVNDTVWNYTLPSQARMTTISIYFGEYEPVVVELDTITVTEALAIAKALAPEKGKSLSTDKKYAVKGYVVGSSTKYENTYYMADTLGAYGEFQAYKCATVDREVAVNDYVIVTGKIMHYYGSNDSGEWHNYEISGGDLIHGELQDLGHALETFGLADAS